MPNLEFPVLKLAAGAETMAGSRSGWLRREIKFPTDTDPCPQLLGKGLVVEWGQGGHRDVTFLGLGAAGLFLAGFGV